MNDRPSLAEQIALAQDRIVEGLDATRGHRRARFAANARRPPRGRSRRTWWVAGAALACIAVVLVVGMEWNASQTPPPVLTEREAIATATPEASAQPERDDGVVRIAEDATAQLDRRARGQTRVALSAGRVEINAYGPARHLVRIAAGPFNVTSEDANAQVVWQPETGTLNVTVVHGEVQVESAVLSTHRVVVAGQSVHFQDVHVERGPKRTRPSMPREEAKARTPAKLEKRPTRSTWRSLAAEGKHDAAVQAAADEGYATVIASATASELLTLSRSARYARDTPHAKQALAALRKRFPKSKPAARAAYSLGRVAYDFERDYGAAAGWFRTYVREQKGGALVREALGREVEALHKDGAAAAARLKAQRYLERFPDGPHADIARSVL